MYNKGYITSLTYITHFSQVCSIKVKNNDFTSNNWSFCGYLYCDAPNSPIETYDKKKLCRITCPNLDKDQLDNIQCNEETSFVADTLSLMNNTFCNVTDPMIQICDNVCDCPYCQDESQCNGLIYGKICRTVGSLQIEPPLEICNNVTTCFREGYLRADELGCDRILPDTPRCIGGEVYRRKGIKKVIPIFNYTRCSAIEWSIKTVWYGKAISNRLGTPYCLNYIDQTNCTDVSKIAVRCIMGADYHLR